MRLSALALTASLASVPVSAKVYFKEQFNDEGWTKRWTQPSKWKPAAEMGKLEHTAGKWFGDEKDKGIQTSEDSRFYGLSAQMDTPYKSDGKKPLVFQYSVKHEQQPKLDCGGAYLKLLPGGKKFDANSFGGDTKYAIMFGPDVCGPSNKRTHVIFHSDKKDDNLLIKKEVSCETDALTHLYTLAVHPDNTFEVFIDKKSVRKGKLEDEFDFLEPQKIKDPDAKKPDDWVDEKTMPDPNEKKPDGWDDIPMEIADPEAKKPEDWDDEDDGEWEPPMLDNPEYKGEWEPTMIENPDYKGPWEHPMVANPAYAPDDKLYAVCKDACTHVGFELWQVTAGSLFDDILVSDDVDEAFAFADETFFKKKDEEKKMYDAIKEEERKKEDEEKANNPDATDLDDDTMDDDAMEAGGFGDEF